MIKEEYTDGSTLMPCYDRQIISFVAQFKELTNDQICDALGITQTELNSVLNKQSTKHYLKTINAPFAQAMIFAQTKALKKCIELIDSEDEKIALDTSKFLLSPHVASKAEVEVRAVTQTVHSVQFGEHGELISKTIQKEADSLELISTLQN